jgi:hypothetical protein
MAKKEWTVTLDGRTHQVEAEHGYLSGAIKVRVNGQEVFRKNQQHMPWNPVSRHPFTIDGHPLAFHIRSNNLVTYKYDLEVDGRSITTGEPVSAPEPLPVWVWGFAVLAVPILFILRGLLPDRSVVNAGIEGGIAGLMIALVVTGVGAVARLRDLGLVVKLAFSAAVVAAGWGVAYALVALFGAS